MHPSHGYAAPELEITYARARTLCARLGEHPLTFGVLIGISAFHFMRAELQTSAELLDHVVRLAEKTGNPVMSIWASWVYGATYAHIGENYDEALRHLDEGAQTYSPAMHPQFMLLTGFDAGIGCHMQAARVAWLLGRADEALDRSQRAVRLARELRHPLMISFALFFHAWVHQYRDEPYQVRAVAEESLSLSGRYGYPQITAWTQMLNGWAMARLGDQDAGAAVIREGIATTDAMGVTLLRPTFLAYLAEAELVGGRADAALTLLAQADQLAARTGERGSLPEIRRLVGDAQLQRGDSREVVAKTWRDALEVAQQQQARGFAERIEGHLARL
jgi:predicted ATPase